MKSTEELLKEITIRGIITEKEIALIKKRSNAEQKDLWDYNLPEVECTPEQTEKALKWLKDLYQTPRGIERKNNPFGYREEDVILDPSASLFFDGYYQDGNYIKFFVPICTVTGAGASFQYYVSCGKINIIG